MKEQTLNPHFPLTIWYAFIFNVAYSTTKIVKEAQLNADKSKSTYEYISLPISYLYIMSISNIYLFW